MISRHELELVSLLTDKDIENIRKDICEECNIEYCEKNLPYIECRDQNDEKRVCTQIPEVVYMFLFGNF